VAGLLTEPRWLGQETGHSHPGLLRGYLEDFSEWAGHHKLKLKREAALERFAMYSSKLGKLTKMADNSIIQNNGNGSI